ncbi:MAG: adenylate kinase family protein [Candidatus Hodarchaeota archaeon]
MKIVIISGTPGVGKTTVASLLKNLIDGIVISLTKFVLENDLFEMWDEERETRIIDEEKVRDGLLQKIDQMVKTMEFSYIIVEGNFADIIGDKAHHAIVLRLHPDVLRKRLEDRNYKKEKIKENVQAEILGVCSGHMKEILGYSFHDIDTTGKNEQDVSRICKDVIEGNVEPDIYKPGLIDWISSTDINLIEEFKKE